MLDKLVVGKTVLIPCMRKGLCAYESPVKETVLVSQDVLTKMSKTSFGIPVVIEHQAVDSSNVEEVTVGRVADMHYDDTQDLWLAHIVVDTQEAVDKLNSGWGVSTAYQITASGPGGTLNAVPYDREVMEATYKHLAIVETPRYEMAKDPIFYNSADNELKAEISSAIILGNEPKNSKGSKMIVQLFKKFFEPIKLNEGDEPYVKVGEKHMKLSELVTEVETMESKKAEADAAKAEEERKQHVLNDDDVVEYKGEKLQVSELLKRHAAMTKEEPKAEEKKEDCYPTKKQEAEEKKPEDKKDDSSEGVKGLEKFVEEEKKEEEHKNEADAKVDAEAKEKADTLARFNELKNAVEAGDTMNNDVSTIKSAHEGMLEGLRLYGPKN